MLSHFKLKFQNFKGVCQFEKRLGHTTKNNIRYQIQFIALKPRQYIQISSSLLKIQKKKTLTDTIADWAVENMYEMHKPNLKTNKKLLNQASGADM